MSAGDSSARDVEVPASPLVADTPLPFSDVCARIHDRITAFLEEKDVSERVKSVQRQTKISLDVLAEALDKYQYGEGASGMSCGELTCAQQASGALSGL